MMAFGFGGPIGSSDLQPRFLWTYLVSLVTLAQGNPFISLKVSPLFGLVCVLPSLENMQTRVISSEILALESMVLQPWAICDASRRFKFQQLPNQSLFWIRASRWGLRQMAVEQMESSSEQANAVVSASHS